MNKYLLVTFFIIIFTNSCSFSKNFQKSFIKIKHTHFLKKQPDYTVLNFDNALKKIILEMLKPDNIILSNNTLFFIDILENKTNISLNQKKLTESIKHQISEQTNKINFITQEIIEKDKKKLGVSNTINSTNIGTSILLSRNHQARYYLHAHISGKNKLFLLKIKLILVKTGEIIFIKEEKFHW